LGTSRAVDDGQVTFSPTSLVIVSNTCLYLVLAPLILYVKTTVKTDGFGVHIEFVLVVCSVQTKHTDPDESRYGSEWLTCVLI
jgi:hypothetical protein